MKSGLPLLTRNLSHPLCSHLGNREQWHQRSIGHNERKMKGVTTTCKLSNAVWLFALLLAFPGCGQEPDAVFSPLEFARKTLSESYAAKAELGEILEVKHKTNEGLGHGFLIKASKQNATMTLLSITPGGESQGSLWLDDGRQIPLFIPTLEDSYKSDLDR